MDPIVGGALISGGVNALGSMFSNIFGHKNNNKTNETNMKIAQMNNEWNAAEAAKNRSYMTAEREAQNQWNLDQWNRENEYNSASSQRERLEEAGLNPYLMMSGGSSGTASSVSSAGTGTPQNPTADPVRQIPYQPNYDFSGISNAINAYYQNKKTALESQGVDISNNLDMQFGSKFREAQIASLIDGRFELLNPKYFSGRFNEAPNLLGIDLEGKRQALEGFKANIELTRAQESLAYIRADTQKTLNKYLPQQQQADLWIKASQVYENFASGMLSYEKLNTEIANQVKIAAEARGRRIDNKIAASTAFGIIQAMNEQNMYNRDYYRWLRRSARDLAEYDIKSSKANSLTVEHNERIMRANRQWRHVDKTTSQVGNLLGGFVSGAKGAAILRNLRNTPTFAY